jgi:hypothetical protein
VEQKSLRFGGDMKSNPVCARQCKQANLVRFGTKSVLACMFKHCRFYLLVLQYFIPVVFFAVQPFTISGEDK